MNSFGSRLLEERERLGLPQAFLAAHGGVKRNAQANYEKDVRAPDADYLMKVAEVGVDVLYVLTGQRIPVKQTFVAAIENDETTVGSRAVVMLGEREQALLLNYKAADEVGRSVIEGTANLAAQSKSAAKLAKRGK